MPTRRTTRVPAHKVRHDDGFTSHLPAVDLLTLTFTAPHRCAGCWSPLPAGAEHLVSRRVGDAEHVFDVHYCNVACRTGAIGGSK